MDTVTIKGEKVAGQVVYIEIETTTPTRDNNAYSARGFKTLWPRCVVLAMQEKVLAKDDRFTFHDLRAYYATTHKKAHGKLPDLHANPATTAAVYDRNTEVDRDAL